MITKKYLCKPKKSKDITHQFIDNEVILYNPADESLHALNPTAGLAWELCDGQRSISEIAQELANNFHVEHEVALQDLDNIFQQLDELGLLITDDSMQGMQNDNNNC